MTQIHSGNTAIAATHAADQKNATLASSPGDVTADAAALPQPLPGDRVTLSAAAQPDGSAGNFTPIAIVNPNPQQPAAPWQVFALQKDNSDNYSLQQKSTTAFIQPPLDGVFLYTILADDPERIYVGAPSGSVNVDGATFGIQGHTSITTRRDVLYAGELLFRNGRLEQWNNGSGHYKPDRELRHTNLTPMLKRLLPERLFKDAWTNPDFAALRGYAIPPPPVAVAGRPDGRSPASTGTSGYGTENDTAGSSPRTISAAEVAAFARLGQDNGARVHSFGDRTSARPSASGLLLAHALATQIRPPAQDSASSATASDRFANHLSMSNAPLDNAKHRINQELKQWDFQRRIDSLGAAVGQLPSGLQRLRDLPAYLAVQTDSTRLLLSMPEGSASLWVDKSGTTPVFGLADPVFGSIEDIRDPAMLSDILSRHFSQSYAASNAISVRTITGEAATSLGRTYSTSELLGAKRYTTRDLLALQDQRDGLLRIGSMEISRTALHDMGALLNGKPVTPGRLSKYVKRGMLVDRLRFDASSLQQRIRSLSTDVTPEKIQEIVTRTQSIENLGGDKGVVYKGIVFRGDTRPPEVVFNEGFKLRTPINDINEVNGTRGGFGGGHDALDPDGRGISTSAFYQRSGAGAYYYGGHKGGFTYVVDGTALEGFHLYANDHLKKHPNDTKVRLPPSEINYGTDIPRHAVIGAFDRNGKYIASPFAMDGKNLRHHFSAATDSNQISDLLYELGSTRRARKPLIVDAGDSAGPWVKQMNAVLDSAAKTGSRIKAGATQLKNNILTYMLPGGRAVNHTGVGLQAFGIYNGIRSIKDAVARGATTDIAIASAGLAAEGVSLGVEKGVASFGSYLQKGNVASFNAFARTSIGSKLGGVHALGNNIGRTAGVIGTVITTPFDIYSAYSSFTLAAQSEGKTAQDHYVNGSLAVAGAVSSIALAGAAFAGVAAAGPIGIAVGTALALGSNIYSSARYVEDVDAYADLSGWEKFTTGIASFVGSSASQDIEDRVAIAQRKNDAKEMRKAQRDCLINFLAKSQHYGSAIYGKLSITAQKPLITRGAPDQFGTRSKKVTQRPAIVADNGNDRVNAMFGEIHLNNRVTAQSARKRAVYWATGGGHDRLTGVASRSNTFDLGSGRKEIQGGLQNDRIHLGAGISNGSRFDGGDGDDTLDLSSAAARDARTAFTIRLPATAEKAADFIWDDDDEIVRMRETSDGSITSLDRHRTGNRATLSSIENVITARHGRTDISGNDKNNLFVLNGDGDSARGGDGNDIYVVNGAGTTRLTPGSGNNRYDIARSADIVSIAADQPTGTAELNIGWNIDEITVQVSNGNLDILLGHNREKKIRLQDAFQQTGNGQWESRRKDGELRILTADGYLLTPVLSSLPGADDGLLNIIASISPHGMRTPAA